MSQLREPGQVVPDCDALSLVGRVLGRFKCTRVQADPGTLIPMATEPVHHRSVITPGLMQGILEQYRLPLAGFHGLSHWARVRETGLRLARLTGANPDVAELFAVFHDACRHNEGTDSKHGARGARLAEKLRREHLQLDDKSFDLLFLACRDHTLGQTEADVTVQTCWDADRLDLLRVWVTPDPKRLCTDAAKNSEMLDWCNQRAQKNHTPKIVTKDWLVLI